MKCIILAAGYATRLYPLTENYPKPLLKVGDKCILDWLIDDIAEYIDEFVVISNHKYAEHFKHWAEQKPQRITVVDDGTENNAERLGAVRDIQLAVERLGIQDDCLVMAGDNVLDFSLAHFIRFAETAEGPCVMCHPENRRSALQKTAVVTVDDKNRITSFEEKPPEPKGNLAVPPFYFYRASDLHRIPEALAAGCGFDAPGSFAAWLSARTHMYAYAMPGKRFDIGDIQSYQKVQAEYRGIQR